MQDDASVILFASNVSSSTSRASSPTVFNNEIFDRVVRPNIKNLFKLVAAYTNLEILGHLREYGARMVVFHFEGCDDSFQSLRSVCQNSSIGSLDSYLGKQAQLRLVFLSGCATDEVIEDLLNAGVPAVLSSLYHLPIMQIELFAETVESKLMGGVSLEEAIEAGKRTLQAISGKDQRIYVNLRNEPQAKNYSPLPPHIIGGSSRNGNHTNGNQGPATFLAGGAGSSPPNQPPPNQTPAPQPAADSEPRSHPARNWQRPYPFVGNRPFSKEDGDIFFGRDEEVRRLVNLVRDSSVPPVILFSGAAGCGKTSLIQAGLLVDLKAEFEVIELNGDSTPELVSVLRKELTQRTGKDDLLEAWQTLEGNYDIVRNMTERRILLIIDNIDSIINSQHPRDRHEIRRLLYAVLPIYAHSNFRSYSKVILSVRSLEAKDICEIMLELALPMIPVRLPIISSKGLWDAIVNPFHGEPSPGNLNLDDETARRILHDLLSDPTSVQLPFLQSIIECLWNATYDDFGAGATISQREYEALYKYCKLLEGFLNTQLQGVMQQLSGKVDEYTLLKIIWHHCSPHHLSTQRAMQERHLQFPKLDRQLMQETISALCDHHLLITVPADKPGTLQIAHRELSPLVRERLIEMGTPTLPIWRSIINQVTKPFTMLVATFKNYYQPNTALGLIAGQSGQIHLARKDANLILMLFALIVACLVAGFLIDRLFS